MNWRVFLALWIAGLVTALPTVPVVVTLGEAGLSAHPTTWQTATLAVVLAVLVVYSAAIFVGLRIGGRFGLAAPMTEAWIAGRRFEGAAARLGTAALAGAGLGVAGVLVALVFAGPDVAAADAGAPDLVPNWIGLGQALSAGVGEELLFRYGLMSLAAWFAWKVLPGADEGPSRIGMWFAVGIAAIVFTTAHGAPGGDAAGAAMLVAEPMQAVRLLAGVLFGWLFWMQGLEAAMAAHFAYDVALFYGVVAAV